MKQRGFYKVGKMAIMAVFIIVIAVLVINWYVKYTATAYIVNPDKLPPADAILVLGAYVYPDGTMSPMLADLINVGYELYQLGKAPKLLVSGDHGRQDYDEVNTMKAYLKSQGIPSENIFMDHAGFSTYESLYRARDIFKVKKVIIVTQQYHLMRAVFIARELGLEAYGASADLHDYGASCSIMNSRNRCPKQGFLLSKFVKPKPTFLGDSIPVFGDGRATDDK